ncbi:MAG TPA: hypothetical protein VFW62_05050 [bacterium]|nr:hypothetical protein [bacterium]
MKSMAIALCLAFLIGCGTAQDTGNGPADAPTEITYPEHIENSKQYLVVPLSVGCDNCQTDALGEAVRFWNESLGHTVFVEEADPLVTIEIGDPPGDNLGWADCDQVACAITVLPGHETPFILSHELGHALGFGHERNPLSVMRPNREVYEVTPDILEIALTLIEDWETGNCEYNRALDQISCFGEPVAPFAGDEHGEGDDMGGEHDVIPDRDEPPAKDLQ